MSDSVKTIKSDAIIDIKVSGQFYKQVQALLMSLLEPKGQKEMMIVLAKASQNKVENQFEANIQTLLALVKEIETSAEAQNLMSSMPVKEYEDLLKKAGESTQE